MKLREVCMVYIKGKGKIWINLSSFTACIYEVLEKEYFCKSNKTKIY